MVVVQWFPSFLQSFLGTQQHVSSVHVSCEPPSHMASVCKREGLGIKVGGKQEQWQSRLKRCRPHVLFQSKQLSREFPGGPVVRIQCFHCRELGSVPNWETEIPQTTQHSPNKIKKKKSSFQTSPSYEEFKGTDGLQAERVYVCTVQSSAHSRCCFLCWRHL